jgi:hypothetical protein
MSVLTDADDHLHKPVNDDPYWTETVWFGATVPERGIGMNLYPLTRTNLGIIALGIYVWETGCEETWQLPYFRQFWHLRLPQGHDATNFSLPVGFAIERLKPMNGYRLTYADGDALAVDLTFRGLHPAEPYGVKDGYGHLDQIGRVTGEIELLGERIAIDCIDMRDRTWSPRRETSQRAHVGYTYGAISDDFGFHVSSKHAADDGEDVLTSGFLMEKGSTRPLVSGRRMVHRDERGRPTGVEIEAVDGQGRSHVFRGEVISRLAMPTTPYFCWMSVTRWTFPDGSIGYGQDHDSWAPGRLRTFLRRTGR